MSAGRHIYVTNRERRAIIAAAALHELEYDESDRIEDQEDISALNSLIRKLTK